MKMWRLVAVVALIVALVVVSLQTASHSTSAPPAIPCTTFALGQAFHGPDQLDSIQNFGCQDKWAYVWATIGTGEHAIGVTEVLTYRDTGHWVLVSRLTDCKASVLPRVIYRQGCFSN